MVAEVGQRMAQCGQLPVQHGQHARLCGMKHQVVEPKVTMHDGDHALVAGAGGQVGRQPGDQLVHLWDRRGDRRGVLLAPTANLALKVVARFAVAGQAALRKLDIVERRDDPVHLLVNLCALGGCHARQGLVPQHAAFNEFHHVESAPDDGFVLAKAVHLCHRHVGALQAFHDLELTLHRMRGRQQFGYWTGFCAHHIASVWCDEFVGRIRLSAVEHFHRQWPFESFQVAQEVRA